MLEAPFGDRVRLFAAYPEGTKKKDPPLPCGCSGCLRAAALVGPMQYGTIDEKETRTRGEVAVMSEQEIKEIVWQVATESASHGPGWAQEGVVLRAIGDRIAERRGAQLDLQIQQAILNAWHELFLEKKLAWGYDLDNPGSPFFHVR